MLRTVLIGPPGVGKTTLLTKLAALGYQTQNCDQIVNQLYEADQPGYLRIKKVLGERFVNDQGVQRENLSEALARGHLELEQIDQLIHPLIAQRLGQSDFDFCECPVLGSPYLELKKVKVVKLFCNPVVRQKRLSDKKGWNDQQIARRSNYYQERVKPDLTIDTTPGVSLALTNELLTLLKQEVYR